MNFSNDFSHLDLSKIKSKLQSPLRSKINSDPQKENVSRTCLTRLPKLNISQQTSFKPWLQQSQQISRADSQTTVLDLNNLSAFEGTPKFETRISRQESEPKKHESIQDLTDLQSYNSPNKIFKKSKFQQYQNQRPGVTKIESETNQDNSLHDLSSVLANIRSKSPNQKKEIPCNIANRAMDPERRVSKNAIRQMLTMDVNDMKGESIAENVIACINKDFGGTEKLRRRENIKPMIASPHQSVMKEIQSDVSSDIKTDSGDFYNSEAFKRDSSVFSTESQRAVVWKKKFLALKNKFQKQKVTLVNIYQIMAINYL